MVLVAVASLLTAVVTTGATLHGSFAGRLGGEECADGALYDAKRGGRDQVRGAPAGG